MEVGENRFGPPHASSICTCGVRPDPDFIGGRSRENSNKGNEQVGKWGRFETVIACLMIFPASVVLSY